MADLATEFLRSHKMPVIDGVTAAVGLTTGWIANFRFCSGFRMTTGHEHACCASLSGRRSENPQGTKPRVMYIERSSDYGESSTEPEDCECRV